MAVCIFARVTCKNVRQNLISRPLPTDHLEYLFCCYILLHITAYFCIPEGSSLISKQERWNVLSKLANWMPSVASLNPALTAGSVCMLVAPVWCDLGCCFRTVVASNYLCTDPRSYRIACSLYHMEKLILESLTLFFQKLNTRQLFRRFGNSSMVSIIRIRLAFSFALIWVPAQAAKMNKDDSKL